MREHHEQEVSEVETATRGSRKEEFAGCKPGNGKFLTDCLPKIAAYWGNENNTFVQLLCNGQRSEEGSRLSRDEETEELKQRMKEEGSWFKGLRKKYSSSNACQHKEYWVEAETQQDSKRLGNNILWSAEGGLPQFINVVQTEYGAFLREGVTASGSSFKWGGGDAVGDDDDAAASSSFLQQLESGNDLDLYAASRQALLLGTTVDDLTATRDAATAETTWESCNNQDLRMAFGVPDFFGTGSDLKIWVIAPMGKADYKGEGSNAVVMSCDRTTEYYFYRTDVPKEKLRDGYDESRFRDGLARANLRSGWYNTNTLGHLTIKESHADGGRRRDVGDASEEYHVYSFDENAKKETTVRGKTIDLHAGYLKVENDFWEEIWLDPNKLGKQQRTMLGDLKLIFQDEKSSGIKYTIGDDEGKKHKQSSKKKKNKIESDWSSTSSSASASAFLQESSLREPVPSGATFSQEGSRSAHELQQGNINQENNSGLILKQKKSTVRTSLRGASKQAVEISTSSDTAFSALDDLAASSTGGASGTRDRQEPSFFSSFAPERGGSADVSGDQDQPSSFLESIGVQQYYAGAPEADASETAKRTSTEETRVKMHGLLPTSSLLSTTSSAEEWLPALAFLLILPFAMRLVVYRLYIRMRERGAEEKGDTEQSALSTTTSTNTNPAGSTGFANELPDLELDNNEAESQEHNVDNPLVTCSPPAGHEIMQTSSLVASSSTENKCCEENQELQGELAAIESII